MYSLSAGTLIEAAKLQSNFDDLSSGVGDLVANSLETTRMLTMKDHIASGGVITGDSYGVNRNASMTAIVAIIGGKYTPVGAISARTYTASKDTYVDVDYGGTLSYTEVSNNAASPSLAANSIRIGIVVTGATTIAAAASINQGEPTKLLPIASSIPYAVTDSLGNRICPREASPSTVGLKTITSAFSTTSNTQVQVTGLSCPVNLIANKLYRITLSARHLDGQTNGQYAVCGIWDGVVASGTQLAESVSGPVNNNNSQQVPLYCVAYYYATASGLKTFNAGLRASAGNNATIGGSSVAPAVLVVDIVA